MNTTDKVEFKFKLVQTWELWVVSWTQYNTSDYTWWNIRGVIGWRKGKPMNWRRVFQSANSEAGCANSGGSRAGRHHGNRGNYVVLLPHSLGCFLYYRWGLKYKNMADWVFWEYICIYCQYIHISQTQNMIGFLNISILTYALFGNGILIKSVARNNNSIGQRAAGFCQAIWECGGGFIGESISPAISAMWRDVEGGLGTGSRLWDLLQRRAEGL